MTFLEIIEDSKSWRLRLALGRSSYSKNTVYIGTDISNSNRQLWDGNYSPRFSVYDCVEQIYQECSESIIDHEVLHLAVEKAGGKEASKMLNNIDGQLEVTEVGPKLQTGW